MKLLSFDFPVTSKWLELNGRRLDGRPYVSGAVEARVLLEKLPIEKAPLQALTSGHSGGIYNGPQFIRRYVTDETHGVPFLTSSTILRSDFARIGFLSKKDAFSPQLSYLRLEEGIILISCSGTIGRTAYAGPNMNGMWSSQDVLKVVPKQDKILPGYLYTYLSSRFGIPLVVERTYGAVIQHIEPSHIADLPVPLAPSEVQSKTHQLIEEMASLRAKAIAMHKEATTRIFDSVGLIDPSRHTWLSDDRKTAFPITQISSKSLRALNYDPRYLEMCAQIQKHKFDPLGELCDPIHFKSGIVFKRMDAEPPFAIRLVGQRDAFQIRPEGRMISRKSIEGLGLIVPPGTTMIAAHGTLGETELYCRSTYVTERTSEYAFSGDFVRCIPLREKVLPGYLFAFLRSETAFRILRSISIGSKQQAHHPYFLWNIPVPRLEAEKEQEIHELVEAGAQMFDQSLQLEEDAWQVIEDWILQEGARDGQYHRSGTTAQ